MKSLLEYFKSMYVVAIVLLLLLAAVASYNLRTFPANLAIAVAACSVLDVLIAKFILKREFRFPYSGFISGTIIGSIAPLNASAVAILVAAGVAIGSKYVIRIKGRHLFNPATLGLLVSLLLFSIGDQWWAASAGFHISGYVIPLTLLLVVPNYLAGKLRVSVPFLVLTAVLFLASGAVNAQLSAAGLLTLVSTLPFYFAFIMLSEPKTSPGKPKGQAVFGIVVAVLYFALDLRHSVFPYFFALLAGNLAFALFRSGIFKKKSATD